MLESELMLKLETYSFLLKHPCNNILFSNQLRGAHHFQTYIFIYSEIGLKFLCRVENIFLIFDLLEVTDDFLFFC